MSFSRTSHFQAIGSVLLLLCFTSLVDASLYLIKPEYESACHGGKPCTVHWLDDGQSPLLSAIGPCTVGLYTADQQLVQSIAPVDVSTASSLQFTPNPQAGPNSQNYYIGFKSISLKDGNNSYLGFSPPFELDNMQGSFSSPLSSATAAIPFESSKDSSSQTATSTITVGTLSTTRTIASTTATSLSSSPTRSSSLTSVRPTSTSPTGSSQPSSTSNAALSSSFYTIRAPFLLLIAFVAPFCGLLL